MSIVYQTSAAPCAPALPLPFERRWKRVEPLLRIYFAARDDEEYLNALMAEARGYLLVCYTHETLLMDASTDAEWVQLALKAILQQKDDQSLFERQFAVIERRLERWTRLNFKPELIEDVKQGAFLKLWKDYERHHEQWDAKPESYWVASAKLAMRWTNRDLNYPISYAKGSPRRKERIERVQHTFSECDFPDFSEAEEEESNELLDTLCQRHDVDIHGKETQRANLRLDLEILLQLARKHYNPAVFERCLLLLERSAEGYTSTEIRLELGWSTHTYNMTAQQVRQMSQFAEGYQGIIGRANILTEADRKRISRMRKAGYSCTEVARFIGCNPMTVYRFSQTAQSSK